MSDAHAGSAGLQACPRIPTTLAPISLGSPEGLRYRSGLPATAAHDAVKVLEGLTRTSVAQAFRPARAFPTTLAPISLGSPEGLRYRSGCRRRRLMML